MTIRTIVKLGAAVFSFIILMIVAIGTCHRVDDTEWQAVQYMNGKVEIKEQAGIYFALFPKVTEYPRNVYFEFSHIPTKQFPNNESTRVTFNDGGTADIDASIRISTPTTEAQKREFHRQFNGNMDNVRSAVWSHMSNVIKASGPLMSASENQAARKSEFNNIVLSQLNDGLYEMRRVSRELDQVDEHGKKISVAATEVVMERDSQKPLVAQQSPLAIYGIKVTQFSITSTEYDKQTLEQFATKKDAFLRAESAKAQRDGEIQQRLMIEEKGKRELAETTAAANLVKEKATIGADQEKQVAETNAAREVAVALKAKEKAETEASQKLEVAKLARMAAEEEAKQIRILAEAEKDRIAQAGAITEKEKVTLQMQKETAIGVAGQLASIKVPQFVIGGSSSPDGKGGNDVTSSLINLMLLDRNGFMDLNTNKAPARTAPQAMNDTQR